MKNSVIKEKIFNKYKDKNYFNSLSEDYQRIIGLCCAKNDEFILDKNKRININI